MSSRRLSCESLSGSVQPQIQGFIPKFQSPRLNFDYNEVARIRRSRYKGTGCAWHVYGGCVLAYGGVGVAAEVLKSTEAWWSGCGVRGKNPRFLVF
ncbi:hypothetical protein F383_36262 [Gossypium arboreum]|uniref:Uncharacterized protein n=1 Tax=Gossypium arboreum TaxID=29729 RepID=A0A0B0N7Y4_GOSAR|nr:hypothetical protein F383_36262 [Gossypium arboreum]